MQVHRFLLMFGVAALTVAGFVGFNASPVAAQPERVVICHYDVDDEDPWDSIVIEVSERSVDAHFANHGDDYSFDAVGTLDCDD